MRPGEDIEAPGPQPGPSSSSTAPVPTTVPTAVVPAARAQLASESNESCSEELDSCVEESTEGEHPPDWGASGGGSASGGYYGLQ